MRQRLQQASQVAGGLIRRHRPDYQIILFMGVLMLLGLVVLYSISTARVELINTGGSSLDQAHFMQRQLLYLLAGLVGFGIAASVPIALWQKYASKILLLAFGACVVLAITGALGVWPALCTSGACRWFDVGFGTFQPAELVKFGLLLFLAGFLGRRMAQKKINSVSETLVPLGIIVGIATFFIVVLQKDMGSGIAMLGLVATMLFIAGINKRNGLLVAGVLLGAGVLLILIAPHRLERVATFLDPSQDTRDSSYHITQAKIAIGSGGLFGVGLGQGVQAFGYLPEAVNDSIFAVMGEVFGFAGLLAILALFIALLLRILMITDAIHDPPMRLLVAGAFGWIATHVLVNIGAMIGIFPLTGVTLPLLSFGGTSLLFMMLALGLVFQASRYTSHTKDGKGDGNENSYSRRRLGGSRHTSGGRRSRA
ncbi:MAG TPA: FtsW/RodA/SpoVE family cell cycle protein [Candidatus Saccharimonadales bacterium]